MKGRVGPSNIEAIAGAIMSARHSDAFTQEACLKIVREAQATLDWSPWALPFHYDSEGTQILDSKNRLIVDVRGWGFLTGRGACALKMDRAEAVVVQDRIALNIVRLMNGETV